MHYLKGFWREAGLFLLLIITARQLRFFFLLPRHIKTSDHTPLPSVARASAHTPRNCLSKSANRITDARAAWRTAGIVLTHEKSTRTGTLQLGDTATTAQHLLPQQGHQLQFLEKMAQENIPA